jgi:tetratricopeptide (TPR) repeat protein
MIDTPGSAGDRSRGQGWYFAVACLLCAGLLFLSYSDYFHNSFHFDDSHVVEENLHIRSLDNLSRFFTSASTGTSLPINAVYRPLVPVTLAMDYRLGGGLDPWQFHVTQFALLAILGALLVPFYLHLIGNPARRWWYRYLALFMATLFCLHTTNTETLNIISHRSELLSAIGVISAFLLFFSASRGLSSYSCLIPMGIGALAKLPALIFAPISLVYALFYENQLSLREIGRPCNWPQVGRSLLRTAPIFLVALGLFLFIRAMRHPEVELATTGRLEYLITQPFVWLHYVRLYFVPVGLTADTDWRVLEHWYDTRFFAGLLLVALLVGLTWLSSRSERGRPIAFGLSWFMLALLPSSSVIPLAEVSNEHRIFLPYIGLTLATCWAGVLLLQSLMNRRLLGSRGIAVLACVVSVCLLAGHTLGTHQRNKTWRTEETLWLDVTRKSPSNGRALMNYGLTQMSQGKYERALEYFERATLHNPNYSTLEINLGIVRGELGDVERAEAHFFRALELAPRYHLAFYYYARWLIDQKRGPEARAHLERAVKLSPGNPISSHLLMDVYAAAGQTEELRSLVDRVLMINPGDAAARSYREGSSDRGDDSTFEDDYNLGLQRLRNESYLEAALATRQALRARPGSAEALNNLGWALAHLGFYPEASTSFGEALRIRPDFDLAQNNLRWVREQAASREPPR